MPLHISAFFDIFLTGNTLNPTDHAVLIDQHFEPFYIPLFPVDTVMPQNDHLRLQKD